MFIYKNYKTRESIIKDEGLKENYIFAYDRRLYKKLKDDKYRPLKPIEYLFMCDAEVRKITNTLNLIWYEDERVFSNNYFKWVDDILKDEGKTIKWVKNILQ